MTTVVLARAQWPADDADTELPGVAGFIESAFSPLVAAVAERCLSSFFGGPPAGLARGERTAIAIATSTGDLATAAAVATAVQAGRRVPPLLFYQSNLNAVAGYVAARWGLAGPVVCTMPGSACQPSATSEGQAEDLTSRALAEAHATAALLIEDGDADAALVIAANAYLGGAAFGTAELVGPSWWSST
jgi:3-oxoacyl-(acyl-carrier-protein) synthase